MHTQPQGTTYKMRHRGGRPHKPGVMRSPSGKSLGESPEEAMGTALRKRVMDVGLENAVVRDQRSGAIVASNALSGFTLGRLFQEGAISREQYEAGEEWAKLIHRHAAIMGYEVKRSPKSASYIMIGGQSCAPDPDAETIARVREKFRRSYDALMDVCRVYTIKGYKPGWNIADTVYRVCVENVSTRALGAREYGNLRVGLNALGKVLR